MPLCPLCQHRLAAPALEPALSLHLLPSFSMSFPSGTSLGTGSDAYLTVSAAGLLHTPHPSVFLRKIQRKCSEDSRLSCCFKGL